MCVLSKWSGCCICCWGSRMGALSWAALPCPHRAPSAIPHPAGRLACCAGGTAMGLRCTLTCWPRWPVWRTAWRPRSQCRCVGARVAPASQQDGCQAGVGGNHLWPGCRSYHCPPLAALSPPPSPSSSLAGAGPVVHRGGLRQHGTPAGGAPAGDAHRCSPKPGERGRIQLAGTFRAALWCWTAAPPSRVWRSPSLSPWPRPQPRAGDGQHRYSHQQAGT